MDQRNRTTGQESAGEPRAGAFAIAHVDRVRYREGQLLRAADLNADQAYHIAMRRRHHLGGHGWGIVRGLALVLEQDRVVLQPGMAVDGYGRELIVPDSFLLPVEEFAPLFEPAAGLIDVWLFYSRTAETAPPGGRWDCGPGQNNRSREEAKLRLTGHYNEAPADKPRRPKEVPEEDLDFSPHELPPDDPDREWPVFLGRLRYGMTGRGYTIEPTTLPYAALRGDRITAASGKSQIVIGGESAEDFRRFAVSVQGTDGKLADKMVIDREGKTSLHGDTAVLGAARQLLAEKGVGFDPMIPAPKAPAPWQIYRTAIKKNEKDEDPNAEKFHQLRFEIAHPGKKDDPKLYQLVVGVRNGGTFKPCLTVGADCSIQIGADATLNVKGRLIEGPIEPDPDDPRFLEAVRDQWRNALIDNSRELPGELDDAVLGSLKITNFTTTANPVSGKKFDFKFTVSNPSGAGIVNVISVVTVTFNHPGGKSENVPVDSIKPFDLPAGDSKPVSVTSVGSLPTPLPASLLIQAVVMGTGPIRNIVSDRFELRLPVTPSEGQIS